MDIDTYLDATGQFDTSMESIEKLIDRYGQFLEPAEIEYLKVHIENIADVKANFSRHNPDVDENGRII